ncbi:MAG: Nif3-like dinuclear metal center hexameric protein [Clostridia bacterium]|nr:Nif3-like dinuclear metal center hexameric protein [Clostridia bacterium]
MVNLCEITEKLESAHPLSYACSWDNVGLLVGNREKEVSRVLVALDFDIEVAKEAKEMGAELILTHHPIMFSPINKITSDTPMGRALLFLIENGIALYAAHTNLDCAPGGINDYLVELYGFKNMRHTDIEPDKEYGLGRISDLESPMTLKQLASHIGKKLNLDHIYYIGRDDAVIKTAFTCSGSGASLISADKNADVFITGDIKYSGARDFHEQGLNVIYAGHYDTEIHATKLFEKTLAGLDVEIIKSSANTNIVKTQEL